MPSIRPGRNVSQQALTVTRDSVAPSLLFDELTETVAYQSSPDEVKLIAQDGIRSLAMHRLDGREGIVPSRRSRPHCRASGHQGDIGSSVDLL